MPNSSVAEVYFIVIMMILIVALSTAAMYVFFRQYNREKRAREEAKIKKLAEQSKSETAEAE